MLNKRNITIMMLFALVLLLAATGCTQRGLESYQEAVRKTDEINSGVNATDVFLHYTFDKTDLSESEISALENYEEINLQFENRFNKEQDRFAIKGHINFGGLGFDGSIYKNDSGTYIFLPVVNRFVKWEELLESDAFKAYAADSQTAPPLSQEAMDKLQQVWLDLLAEDNVFKGSPVLMDTPDGELKASVYEITLTPEQIDRGLKNVLAVLREDKEWVAFIDEQLKKQGQMLSFDELLRDESWKQVIESGVAFKFTSYVDRDGYIIKEHIVAEVTLKASDSPLKSVQFGLESSLSNRDQVNKIESPEFTEDNTMRPDKLKEWLNGYGK